jgi:hypothetical protein
MGGAIIFVVSLAGFAIVNVLFLSYLCHCFLHVLGDSSGGVDEIRWPSEVIFDWWWKPLYCLGMLGFWSTTAGVIVAPFFLNYPAAFGIVFPILLWLIYPIGMLCPMAANNVFMLVNPSFLVQLARQPRGLILVGVLTLPLPIATVAMIDAMLRHNFAWALGAAVVLPAAVLFYARAWGRLAWLVLNAKQKGRKITERVSARSPALAVDDPWQAPEPEIPEMDVEVLPVDVPPTAIKNIGLWPEQPLESTTVEEVEDEWSPHKKPFRLVDEKTARREWQSRRRVEQPLEEGYETTGEEPPPTPIESEKYRALNEKEEELKAKAAGMTVREWKRAQKPPTFRRAMGWGLFAFLFYEPTIKAWVNLACLTLAELLFVYLIFGFWPAI